jgi:flavin-dependent dehydrogenase
MIDLQVVGGGPAGLATALYAVRAGLSVVVHEPRTGPVDKACGEGLMPAAVTALADLGIDPKGAPLRGIRYLDAGHCVEAVFRSGPGRGVRRTVLHAALLEAVAGAGIEILHSPARSVSQDDAGVDVEAAMASRGAVGRSTSRSVRSRYLVAADGLHSPLRRQLGLEAQALIPRRFGLRRHFRLEPWTDRVEVHWSGDTEAYVTPVAAESVGVALLTSRREGFDQQLRAFPALVERLGGTAYGSDEQGGARSPVRGAGPLRQRSRHRVAGRVLLVGDASGYVDALTGEGIALALAQARAAVRAMVVDDPHSYERRWRSVTWRHAALTHSLLAASRVGPVRRRLVPWAQARPGAFAWAVNSLAAPSAPPATVTTT